MNSLLTRHKYLIAAAVLVLFAAAMIAVVRASSYSKVYFKAPIAACPNCNVIFISIDTLRADHIGSYGYERGTTPHIDAFSKEAAVFLQHIAQAPSTLASHAAMFTSRIPSHHGASISRKTPLRADLPIMGEIFKSAGFQTASFNSGGQIGPKFGLGRGFDIYSSNNVSFLDVVSRTQEWITANGERPFLLFLHTYEVHAPYTPAKEHLARFESGYSGTLPDSISVPLLNSVRVGEKELTAQDIQHIINAYDAEIFSMDQAFGVLVDFLKKQGLFDRTLIVFTSDHGEEFNEHRTMGWHSHTLFDELLRVPLIIKFPGSQYAGTIVEEQVRSIDMLPTMLHALGVPEPPGFEGQSLLTWFGEAKKETLYAISQRDAKNKKSLPFSVRTPEWKLIGKRLFRLSDRPCEKCDVYDHYPHVVASLEAVAKSGIRTGAKPSKDTQIELDEQTVEQLKTLGYLN